MVLSNTSALGICSLLVLFIVAVVGVEQVLEFADFMTDMHSLDMRIPQLSVLKLLLQILEFFAGLVVEGVEDLLQPLLFPRIRHVCGACECLTLITKECDN